MAQYPAVIELASIDGSNGFQLNGASSNAYSGWSVASAGDVNGDGLMDLIIGAPGFNSSSTAGAAYVVFGRAGGFPPEVNLFFLNGTEGFKIAGEAGGDFSGVSVASVGDLNSDGFDDLIIASESGDTHVVFGRAAGFPAELNVATLDGNNGFQITGDSATSVASAGDVNGDGFADLIIGTASFYDGAAAASYVVFGRATGFPAELALSSLNGANGFKINPGAPYDYSGGSVASAGDVNGDGFDDLIVGAPEASPNGGFSGAAYVVFGHAGSFAAEVNPATLNGSNGFRIGGEAGGTFSGNSVASAGDVNGDGFADLIIGAPAAEGGGAGASYVVFGKAGGFAADLNLSTLDGSNGFQMSGNAGDQSGWSVASAGDVNGDGFDDLLIGTLERPGAGASYVVFGKAGGFAANLDLLTLDGSAGFRLNGEAGGQSSGQSVASAGDINRDGLDDLIIGSPTAHLNGERSGISHVVFGRMPDAAVSRIGTDIGQNLVGGDFGDTLDGRGGADRLFGHGGWDTLQGGAGDDSLDGGAGDDSLRGGRDNDRVLGGDHQDTLYGDRGHDTLDGGAGHDVLYGGTNVQFDPDGNDLLRGGDGDDRLQGNTGDDVLEGGGGRDYARGGGDHDVLDGGADSDELYGDRGRDTLRGGDGDDILFGNTNVQGDPDDSDRIEGGAGADFLQGNVGLDTLLGGDGADTVRGGADDDSIEGGAGGDQLWGDMGVDRITGGPDNDLFVFLVGNAPAAASFAQLDRITDFDQAGDDRLALGAAGSDGNYREAEATASSYEAAVAAANALLEGAVSYAAVAYDFGGEQGVLLFWDTDANGDADQAVALVGTTLALMDPLDIL